MQPFKRYAAVLLLIISQANALELLPRNHPVPGGVARIPIRAEQEPQVFFGEYRVPLLHSTQDKKVWVALVGIPLARSAGSAELRVIRGGVETTQTFSIKDQQYRTQKLSVESKYVEPPAEVQARIEREQKELQELFASYSPNAAPLRFLQPVEGIASDSFGSRREFNGQARNPHSGMDIAAETGTPVVAATAGRVVLAKDMYFNGNTVVLDHGKGILTLYCHLEQIDVTSGQMVKQGERIASVGATGRVTGPHLHWSVSLSGARVDPALFLPQENKQP